MKYSVIIPVYKAEETIEKCVDSLLAQPHDDVEILLVNDGSPDGSGALCRAYAEKHPCVRYFEKPNGGVSSARNLGLREAAGEYILFVDSDDYVTDNYFAAINAALERLKPDLLLFGIRSIGARTTEWKTGRYVADDPGRIARRAAWASRAYLFSNIMSKVFRADLIRSAGLRFDETLSIGEDQAFVFAYTMHIRKMASIPDTLYCLVSRNPDSLSRKRRDYLARQLLQVNRNMLQALDGAQLPRAVRNIYYDTVCWSHYRSAYSACKELLKYDLTAARRRQMIGQICSMYTVSEMKPRCYLNRVIAFPVIHRMCLVVDLMICFRRKRPGCGGSGPDVEGMESIQ